MAENSPQPDYRNLLQDAVTKIRELKARVAELERGKAESIAVVGMGCRFPGVNGLDDYWQLLRDGVHLTADSRTLDDLAKDFDSERFGVSRDEAASMDPQHKLLLETVRQTLDSAAGISSDDLYGKPVGVFIGISSMDHACKLAREAAEIDKHYGPGISHSTAAGRISHWLGIQGPSVAVDTACSSSLVAVHLASQSLRNGECDAAIAAGVNLIRSPESDAYFEKAGLLSASGLCRAFDAAADGVARSEGCGAVLLKRLSDADRDGDQVLAVIRGSAVNHDGPSGGLTVPNGPSQQNVIRRALESGGVDPLDVSLIEAHGAGTSLGDSIEIGAIAKVYCQGRNAGQPLLVASHKTNLGHLEAAGGITGFLKSVLAIQQAQVPAHLHQQQPNPAIPWDDLAIQVPTHCMAWPDSAQPIVGVSSFSFSGTNAHVVLSGHPNVE